MVGDRQLTCQASGCPLNDAIDREYHPNAHPLFQAWRLHSLNESVMVRNMLIRAFLQRQHLINCDTSKSILYSLRDPYPASALSRLPSSQIFGHSLLRAWKARLQHQTPSHRLSALERLKAFICSATYRDIPSRLVLRIHDLPMINDHGISSCSLRALRPAYTL